MTTAAFLVADSALTSNDSPRLPVSTFGERHGPLEGGTNDRNVEERVLRLSRIGRSIATYAGSSDAGDYLLCELRNAWVDELAPADGFERSVRRVIAKFGANAIAAMLAYFQNGESRIAVFNRSGDSAIEIDVDCAQIGTMDDAHQELTQRLLETVPSERGYEERQIVQILGIVQSYGVHRYLIERGVGGGFCGAYVDSKGAHWQPDILFVLHDSQLIETNLIGSLVRDDFWFLLPSIGGVMKAMGERLPRESAEICRQRIATPFEEAKTAFDNAMFDYVVLLSTSKHIVTVIEMRKSRQHKLIILEPTSHPGTIGIYWSPELRSRIDEIPQSGASPPPDFCTYWIPFEPVPADFRLPSITDANGTRGTQP